MTTPQQARLNASVREADQNLRPSRARSLVLSDLSSVLQRPTPLNLVLTGTRAELLPWHAVDGPHDCHVAAVLKLRDKAVNRSSHVQVEPPRVHSGLHGPGFIPKAHNTRGARWHRAQALRLAARDSGGVADEVVLCSASRHANELL